MRIKRIEADNMTDGMRELRRELGDHALILHTRQLAPKGVTGWFKAPRVEILGAVDEPAIFAADAGRPDDAGLTVGGRPSAPAPTRATAPARTAGQSAFAKMQAAATASIQLPARPAVADPVPADPRPARKGKTKRGIAEPAPAPDPQRQAVAERLARFRASNRSLPIAGELIDVEPAMPAPSALVESAAAAPATAGDPAVTAGIRFGVGEWTRVARRARRIAFVGPTGAGKTTTLAKLAARAQLDHGCRVGLITIDTYRIGAVPQLGAYADILKTPLEVAHTPEELSHALARLADRDVVFIDTIGRSPLGDGVDALVPFLATAAADEVHLVLSATTRPNDSMRAARSFARLVPNRLVVTKIDETEDYDALGTVARATGLPLTWLGVGQEVPDDLEAATPERIGTLLAATVAA